MKPTAETTNEHFEIFFKGHYQALCSYAFNFLKDDESSEDIVQDVFIKVWEQRKDLIGRDELKFYLFTAVRNNCLTYLKKHKKKFQVELRDEDVFDEISIRLDDADVDQEPKELIAKAMEQLPPKCREVFMLSRLSNQTYQQIADSLGLSVKTVENQMGKAIKILKVFAKENNIYLVILLSLTYGKYGLPTIGVFIEKLFY